MKQLLTAMFVCLCLSFQASANDPIKTAQKFLQALEASDLATVENLIHDNIRFEDPTWGSGLHVGRDTVLKVYRGYTGGAHNIQSAILNAFESNGVVVLDMMLYAEMDTAIDTKPEDRVPVMARGVRIIEFKEGKVVRHIDLADYGKVRSLMAQPHSPE